MKDVFDSQVTLKHIGNTFFFFFSNGVITLGNKDGGMAEGGCQKDACRDSIFFSPVFVIFKHLFFPFFQKE